MQRLTGEQELIVGGEKSFAAARISIGDEGISSVAAQPFQQ
jgi:hypothetical protein